MIGCVEIMNRNATPRHPIFRHKGIAIALSFCLIAVGAASFFGIRSAAPDLTQTLTGQASEAVSSVSTPSAPARYPGRIDASSAAPSESTGSVAPMQPVDVSPESEETVDVVTPTASFFVLPITGEILKDYKADTLQYSATYGDWRLHTGVDIAGSLNDAVKAAGDGTVTRLTESAQWGTVIEINHGNGVIATYCGLSVPLVKVGDTVKVNQQIASLGEIPCEGVEAIHLHLEMTKENTPVDPLHIMGVQE